MTEHKAAGTGQGEPGVMSGLPPSEKTLFLAAVDKPAGDRTAYLEQACSGDAGLRARIEALLAAHDGPDALLDHAAREHFEANPDRMSSPDRLSFLGPAQRPGSLGRLDHYEVLEVLGQGGMGIVFKAYDAKLQRVVAIKAMVPEVAANATARQRFIREARAAAAVVHDNVIAIYAVEDQGPIPYLVMYCVDGKTLQDKLDRGPLELTEVLRIGLQIADGLAAAHRQGLVHRDVKPANILLENGVERVKITDFGLARSVDDASLTQSGIIAGTPMYMSPEQANGDRVDHRSDLFSLGSVLYATCCGQPPFHGGTTLAVLKRVTEQSPEPLVQRNPMLPGWLIAIVERLMAKSPAERFQSAAEVAIILGERLTQVQVHGSGPTAVSKPASIAPRWRRKHVAAVAAGLVAAGMVGLWLSGVRYNSGPEKPELPAAPAKVQVAKPTSVLNADGKLPDPLELADRHAAADALDPKNIPAELLALAGRGDPRNAPSELVAMFGENKHHGDGLKFCHLLSLSFSPDGKTLAVGTFDQTLRLWDVATGKVRHELTGHRRGEDMYAVYSIAFSPDGTILASGDRPGSVKLWDPSSGRELATLSEPGKRLNQLAISPNGELLAVARSDGTIDLWDLPAGKSRGTFQAGMEENWCVAFSPDSRLLAVGNGRSARLWNPLSAKQVAALAPHRTDIRLLAFRPDGGALVTSATAAPTAIPARVFDMTTLKLGFSLEGHTSTIVSGAWRADGQLLATSGDLDGTVRLWDMTSVPPRCKVLQVVPPGVPWLHAVAFSPEGRYLAVGHPAGIALILRLAKPGEVFRVP